MAATNYVYPKTKELEEVEQKLLPKLMLNSPIFEFFPFDSSDSHLLEWEQKDNYTGLQQLRGYNGKPQIVSRVAATRYRAEPGVYGEFEQLDEEELTTRRRRATYSGGPIPIADLVGEAFEQLLNRRLNLVEKIVWDLLVSGAFSVANPITGVTYGGSYTQQVFTPSPLWSNLETSTPLADMRKYRQFGLGQSCSFGAGAVQFCNFITANFILNNNNPDDLGGKRIGGGSTFNDLTDVNKILVMNDIPPIQIYDEGYIDSSNTFQLFIPTGSLVVMGRRTTGRKIGRYRYTRNINSPTAAPTPYSRVIFTGEREIPATIEVHDGHNGGPVIQFPGSAIKVAAA